MTTGGERVQQQIVQHQTTETNHKLQVDTSIWGKTASNEGT